eukprot:CAMPEP_0202798664 /NCGR_PEP_ID=MMETSP1388-20130828/96706_1 /ASSEMBLY_ACC=CAM_ASM_000864 /TAXON_ID=37098 /ORGANISM="Isochrysis sp, Strain CCMP1244" /LENGTH=51 /DNA_ID=CAMNT_0049468595 /DNA_START=106 /DNA_END=257 /DNA_ORIENTATION=-
MSPPPVPPLPATHALASPFTDAPSAGAALLRLRTGPSSWRPCRSSASSPAA